MTRTPRHGSEDGYSLLETLAAMFLVALASSVVAASLPTSDDPQREDVLAFAAKLDRAAEEAVISGLVVGVEVDEAGYRFRRRIAGEWTGFDDQRVFAERSWPEEAVVAVFLEGGRGDARRFIDVVGDGPVAPTLRLDPTGAATPAEVMISYRDADYRVLLNANASIDIEADDAR